MWSFWKEPFLKNYICQQVQDKGRQKSYQTKDSHLGIGDNYSLTPTQENIANFSHNWVGLASRSGSINRRLSLDERVW